MLIYRNVVIPINPEYLFNHICLTVNINPVCRDLKEHIFGGFRYQ